MLKTGKRGNGVGNTADGTEGESLGVVVHELAQGAKVTRKHEDVMIAVKAIGFQLDDVVTVLFVHVVHPVQHVFLVLALLHVIGKRTKNLHGKVLAIDDITTKKRLAEGTFGDK